MMRLGNLATAVAALAIVSTLLVGCKADDDTGEGATSASIEAANSIADDGTAPSRLGHFRYMADAARFVACGDDVEYPVATEGDNAALERAYLQAATKPAEKLLVRFEGNLVWQPKFDPASGGAGEKERAWYVERFVGLQSGSDCP